MERRNIARDEVQKTSFPFQRPEPGSLNGGETHLSTLVLRRIPRTSYVTLLLIHLALSHSRTNVRVVPRLPFELHRARNPLRCEGNSRRYTSVAGTACSAGCAAGAARSAPSGTLAYHRRQVHPSAGRVPCRLRTGLVHYSWSVEKQQHAQQHAWQSTGNDAVVWEAFRCAFP